MSPSKPVGPLTMVFFLALAWSGCVFSVGDSVEIASDPEQDDDYSQELEVATRSDTVYKNFETRFQVSATLLSPRFRSAFGSRFERVFLQGDVKFSESSGKASFFVTIFSPEEDRTDLTNHHHWTLFLDAGQGALKPMLIKALGDKERWRAFFPQVSDWTKEYLVVFNTASVDPNSPELVEKTSMKFTFANADGQVSLAW